MKIKSLPDDSRPRERFLKRGAEALSNAELLAIILRTGNLQENVIEMSNRLLSQYNLDKLFDCSLKELQEIKGIGPSKAMQILAIAELSKRASQIKNPIKKITNAKDVFDLFHERLKDDKQENFIVLMLSAKNNIIGDQLVFKGTLDSALIHPREVFKAAIRSSASKIILVHNHPSGDPAPSEDDLKITQILIDAGKMLNIPILDHVIVGKEKWWNWVERKK
ncbi:DNA repair protein RadC [Candidatus Pacearchaeota archaeon]|nr:DNA repair protein RadC [Candidatus Pacearchaeota archaeon]